MLYLDLLDDGEYAVMQRITPNGTPYLIPAANRPREVDPKAKLTKKMFVQLKFPPIAEHVRERLLTIRMGADGRVKQSQAKVWHIRMRRDEPAIEFAVQATFPPSLVLELKHMGEYFDKDHAAENDVVIDEYGQEIIANFVYQVTQVQSSPLVVMLDPIWVQNTEQENHVMNHEPIQLKVPMLVGGGTEEEEQELIAFPQVTTAPMDRESPTTHRTEDSGFEPFKEDPSVSIKGAMEEPEDDDNSDQEPEDPNDAEVDEDAGPDRDEFEEMENERKEPEDRDPEIEKRSLIKKGPHQVMAHTRGDEDQTKATTVQQSRYAHVLQEVPSDTLELEPPPKPEEEEETDATSSEEGKDRGSQDRKTSQGSHRPSTGQGSQAGSQLRQGGQESVSEQSGVSPSSSQSIVTGNPEATRGEEWMDKE